MKFKIYNIIFSPVILYGCETWEEHTLRMMENKTLRIKKDKLTGNEGAS
jgi:hypothetical protein